ncbi:MAG TPA: hypothetical protein VD833_03785 [Vicinamibacterales bacterium]|nr:hypothetical protein [Vicinamibacterales bacterium]
MTTTRIIVAVVVCTLAAAVRAAGQEIPIGIIDFYGLSRVPADRARSALTFKEGDTLSLSGDGRPAVIAASEARLTALPGVRQAQINLVCCDNGRAIVYVGIEELGAPATSFRAAPEGNARLEADVVQAGDEYSQALVLAVQRGDAGEDRSRGHALAHDPGMRAIQERFVIYARRDLPRLRRVLRSSSNAAERALAAQVLGYAADKSAVVDDLVYGMTDPADDVRNNAMRALLVIAEMAPAAGRPVPRIPPEPFIALLGSPKWTDRNKSSGALEVLTRNRDQGLLETLQRQAISPLVEMARWKSEGHARPAFLVLARIAGYSDEAALDVWGRGERERVIRAAVALR